jgi:putative DNA primase/helicase
MNRLVKHAELAAAEQSVASSPDKLHAVQKAAVRLSHLVANGDITEPDAMEALCAAAQDQGPGRKRCSREDIEHVVGLGLKGLLALPVAKMGAQSKAAVVNQVGHVGRLGATSGGTGTVKLRCMNEIAPEPVQWLWPGRLAAGKVALLFGPPGIGKSQLCLDIAARITTGAEWPDGGSAPLGNVIILSSEDGLADTVRPRLDAAGADVNRIHVVEAVRNPEGLTRTFNLAADLEALEREIGAIKGNVRLVEIDPVTSYMGRIDSHRTTDVRGVLEPLAAFAERQGVAVLAISHPPKATPAKAMNAVTGSGAYVAFARSVFLVEEEPDTDRRLLLPVKSSLAVHPAGLGFHLEERDPGTGVAASHVVWSSHPVTITADEALAASAKAKTIDNAVAEAEGWLAELLRAGPISANDAKEQAHAAGIAERTLRRAQKNLRVIPHKDGFGGGWRWHLPETAPKAAKDAEGGQEV